MLINRIEKRKKVLYKVSYNKFFRENTPIRSVIATNTLPLLLSAKDSGYSIPLVINC